MRSSTPLLNSLVARALLALALLFAQQTASLHALSHAIDAAHAKAERDADATPGARCDECLMLAALDAAAAGGSFSMPVVAPRPALTESPIATPSPTPLRLAFHSRAPPTLI